MTTTQKSALGSLHQALWGALFLLGLSGCATAPVPSAPKEEQSSELRAAVAKAFSASGALGLTVAVEQKGKLLLREALGQARLGGAQMTPQTIVRVGSVTKMFTAVAVLQLVAAGKLALQDKVGRYLEGLPAKMQSLTVRQLLSHTSGLPDYVERLEADPALEKAELPFTQLLALVSRAPLLFLPGTRWSYSNTNYLLLGRLIETVAQEPWERFLSQKQLQPAGLTSTAPCWAASAPLAQGYAREKGARVPARQLSLRNAFAAGSLCSTPTDLVRWLRALVSGKLLDKKLLDQAWSRGFLPDGTPLGYGLGFGLGYLGQHRTVGHAGGIRGFSADLLYLPATDEVVALVLNQEDAPAVALARGLMLQLTPPTRGSMRLSTSELAGHYLLLGQLGVDVSSSSKGITLALGKTVMAFEPLGQGHFCPQQGCAALELSFVRAGAAQGFLLDKDGVGVGARKVVQKAPATRPLEH